MSQAHQGRDALRLLVLEDDPALAFLVKEQLELHLPGAYAICNAFVLEEALELLRSEEFDAILADLKLPDSAGASTIAALRAAAPQLPIVVLTSERDEDLSMQIIELGVQDYILKGTETGEQLHRAIRHAIQRKRMETRLEYQAQYDPLTGLPNRSLFRDRADHAVARAKRTQKPLAILFLDLDGFKSVNDSLGHSAGDQLLCVVANRLVSTLRPDDTVARLSGDEFAVLLENIAQSEDAAVVAQKIQNALTSPISLQERDVFISTSIGIATYPRDGESAEVLLRHADAAMYRVKHQGRNGYQFFAPEMQADADERLSTVNALRRAFDAKQFRLYYQPIVQLENGRVVGLESLLRWEHPEHGIIAPSSFLSAAEESGLIAAIDEWALQTACHQYQAWRRVGMAPLRLKINISARQFWHTDIARTVTRALETSGMQPQLLTLELNEKINLKKTEMFHANVAALRTLHVQFSIDDFGTGHSSLSHLRALPIDSLKIDRSFVHSMVANRDSAAIVNAIISLGHNLHLRVIAEGVETEEQADFLRARGCKRAQGFLFSEPLPAEKVLAFLHKHGTECDASAARYASFAVSERSRALDAP